MLIFAGLSAVAVSMLLLGLCVWIISRKRERREAEAYLAELKAQMKEWEDEGYNVSHLKDLFK